jgi:predicted GNAT family acetyltransferase
MRVITFPDAHHFLDRTQSTLEQQEATNSLMLGIAMRLDRYPERIEKPPLLKAVEVKGQLALAAIMTPPYKLILTPFQAEIQAPLHALIQEVLDEGWSWPGIHGPSAAARQTAEQWSAITQRNYRAGMRERIFDLRQVITPDYAPGHLRLATPTDMGLATRWVTGFREESPQVSGLENARQLAENRIHDQNLFLWEDGRPVSMACTTRPTTHGISIGLVYTPPELRRRGYATSCVARLSQLLLDSGWEFCCLYTDLANPTSNHIYQSIGYKALGDFDEYVFESAGD